MHLMGSLVGPPETAPPALGSEAGACQVSRLDSPGWPEGSSVTPQVTCSRFQGTEPLRGRGASLGIRVKNTWRCHVLGELHEKGGKASSCKHVYDHATKTLLGTSFHTVPRWHVPGTYSEGRWGEGEDGDDGGSGSCFSVRPTRISRNAALETSRLVHKGAKHVHTV